MEGPSCVLTEIATSVECVLFNRATVVWVRGVLSGGFLPCMREALASVISARGWVVWQKEQLFQMSEPVRLSQSQVEGMPACGPLA